MANYIPELAKANQDDLGIYVVSSDGKTSFAGDFQKRFTIQSIVKPLFLLLALMDNGEEMVRAHVGVEATGKPFDAINYTDQALLSEHLNPMVNMGAILLCTLIKGETYETRFQRLLELTRKGSSKGGMVQYLARRLGIDAQHIYCVGDNQNDIPMMALSAIPADKQPSACIGCRSREAVCPQGIKISEAMADFTAKLGG